MLSTKHRPYVRAILIVFAVVLLIIMLLPAAMRSSHAEALTAAQAAITAFTGVQEGQTLSGKVVVGVQVTGQNITQVRFQLDGPRSLSYTDKHADYYFLGDKNGQPRTWDTTSFPDGQYTLTATAANTAGQKGALAVHFLIANNAQTQPTAQSTSIPQPTAAPPTPVNATAQPAPQAMPKIVGFNGVQEGQTLSGSLAIEAVVSGDNIKQVVFNLNGPQTMTHTEQNTPYYIMGDNSGVPNMWDTTQFPNGNYTLTATVTDAAGQSSSQTVAFLIGNAPPQPTPMPPQPTPAPQTPTFYVSPNGNDGNPGTETQPWKTFYKAASTLRAGQTAIFEDGTYYENQQTVVNLQDGTATAPIVFKARNKHKAVIVYQGLTEWKLHIYTKYVTIQDFDFTQDAMGTTWGDAMLRCWSGADYCKLIGNSIHNVSQCLKVFGNQYALVEGNYCYNIKIGPGVFNAFGTTIRNNEIIPTNDGIQVKGGARSVEVSNNYIHTAGTSAMWVGIYVGGYACGSTSLATCGNFDSSGYEAYNSVAFNNVVVAETPGNIDVGLEMQGCKDCALFNNVAVGAKTGLYTVRGPGTAEGWTWEPTVDNPTITNNIVMNCTQTAANFSDVRGTLVVDNNLFYNCSNPPAQAHGVSADPRFVDPLHDWHLQAGSPAIDAGRTNTFTGYNGEAKDVSYDRAGAQRLAPWDIGAYEFKP